MKQIKERHHATWSCGHAAADGHSIEIRINPLPHFHSDFAAWDHTRR